MDRKIMEEEGFTLNEIQPKEEPIIITEPKVTHESIGDQINSFGMIDKYDYSESHVIYRGLDLGSFEELVKLKDQLKREIAVRDDIYEAAHYKWNTLREMVQKSIIALKENAKDPDDKDIEMMCGTFGRVLNMMDELENKND